MINNIIRFSIEQRFFILLFTLLLIGVGTWSGMQLPIDAVPDITNKQVQINTSAPALAPAEVERQITSPLEVAFSGMPHLKETRSISQFGLSQVTVIFEDDIDIYFARQLVAERLQAAREQLPTGVNPEMGPVTTGLGEIYTVIVDGPQSLMERRTLLDWVVKPQLRKVAGVSEVNSFGGLEKQFQVVVNPQRLLAYHLTLRQVTEALEENNQNAGGAYIRRGDEQELVRGVGFIRDQEDIRNIVLSAENGTPVCIKDVADVTLGPAIRQGAVTRNGKGEAVIGITMLLMGENGRVVVERAKDRLEQVQKTLPAGTRLIGFLDRSALINRTLGTATRNLVEGGILVIVVLFLFLLQLRAGLIVSSAIPLAMLFAIAGMRYYGVSANLMSLGAVDFGLIVDGAVIIVENTVRRLAEQQRHLGRELLQEEKDETVRRAASEVLKPAVFGVGIIIATYIPILTLGGTEGKMFKPMAQTVIFALVGALLLSLTLIPALCTIFLRVRRERENRVLDWLAGIYKPALEWAIGNRAFTVGTAVAVFVACAALFPLLGSEFLPQLDEGAINIQPVYLPSISLEKSIERAGVLERALLREFPDEIDQVITRIGRPEVATDPMLVSQHDVQISLRPRQQWRNAHSKDELVAKMAEVAESMPGMAVSFTQPIQMRMSELIEGIGIRSDLGIKIFGDDMQVLGQKGAEIARLMQGVRGAEDVSVETTQGLPVLNISIRRDQVARYGINVADVQRVIETAVGGTQAGRVVEGNRRFDLVVRLASEYRDDPAGIGEILVPAPGGEQMPLAQLADIRSVEGPVQISRENGERRVVVQANVRGRDLGSFVEEVRRRVETQVKLPTGYHLEYGGTYEHMESGRARLMLVVPVTFLVIFLLLFSTFGSLRQAGLVFTGIPFAITGGILALLLRGMHFSMSAGIGFIALFGVAVLNGVVLVTFINHLRAEGVPTKEAVVNGCLVRLRPVLMTAAVASIGFIPMALAHGAGAEVQKPLATVVIGGLVTSTLLTLFVLPTIYLWSERKGRSELEV
ncbi:MAG: CusA/CzcA family heavy metal efflux RND transporter [Armatimonadetes bacterium]|nr:CusA/CzcA family heavy metal efflux RND transporter [Armatimonadota bacterium]